MKKAAKVVVVLMALIVMTGAVSAAEVRVNYDYAATGIDEGSGLWSLTIDSGLIPNPDADPNDPNSAYLEAGDAVTFVAPMVKPVFTQRDALLEGDVIPDIPGVVGWTNDATDRGQNTGLSWVFYGPNDVVTLRAITEGYVQYTFEVQTILKNEGGDDGAAEVRNQWRWAFSFADNPDGLDLADGEEVRTVSYFGDVEGILINEDGTEEYGLGHRHSGNRFRNDSAPVEGQDICRDGKDGLLGGDAAGDGIGISLGVREIHDAEAPGTASIFLYNVVMGGDVFADTDAIYADTVKLED